MMDFTREQKKEALNKLPKQAKEFLLSDQCTELIQQIGKDNGLLIDKVGDLEDEIFLVIYGLVPSSRFVDDIQSRLGIASELASKIAEETNEKIFLAVRKLLAEAPEQSQAPTSTVPEPSRDSILAEIEDPTPTIHPISTARPTVPGPAQPREIAPVATPAANNTMTASKTVAHDFIAGKLSETVSMPAQKTSASITTPASAP
ncbi:MAG TPA: hypothetical protein VIR98_03640, partial [Candidatus Paceibacterota bacterium]